MKRHIVFAWLLLAAAAVPAQQANLYRAQQQAQRASAQNQAEQQRIQHEVNAAPGAAPVDPVLQATLNNINGLQANFATAASSATSQSDPALKTSLLNNLIQAAQGTKASSGSVQKLADDLLTAVTGKKKLTLPQQTKLARAVHALFNSAHLSETQQQSLLKDVQKILTDAEASTNDAANVAADLRAVVAETK